jgi:hypothetical protein
MTTQGGARVRSGPVPDPRSANSEHRGGTVLLPAGGYDGPVPDFPIPHPQLRDLELWAWAWRSPQAVMWAREPWRQYTVAQWCQVARACEAARPTSADRGGALSLADRIGLSDAGLRFNGWTIARDEQGQPRGEQQPAPRSSSRSRMTILGDDARTA